MGITNLFGAEDLIVDKLAPLFPKDMVFVEGNSEQVTNELFVGIDNDSDKIAAIVLSGGYQADPPVGANKNQRLKPLWQVVIVTPKDLRTNGGTKCIEVLELLKGCRLAKEYDYMKAVSDERGFNRPDYVVDLVYMPMMFSVGTVI